MFIEKIIIPKKILNETYQLNKNTYNLEYFIKKEGKEVCLYPKDIFIEHRYVISAFDLAKKMSQIKEKCIYMIFEQSDDTLYIHIGNTIIMDEHFFVNESVDLNNLNEAKKKIKNFTVVLQGVTGNVPLVVININVKNNVVSFLTGELKNSNLIILNKNEIEEVVKRVKIIEKKITKYIPVLAGIVFIIIAYFISSYFAQQTNQKNYLKVTNLEKELNNEINRIEKQIKFYKNKDDFLKKVLKMNKQIYKG